MRVGLRGQLLLGGSLLASVVAAPAFAQSQPPATAPAASDPGQDASATDEIVVTAQRRRENLQDVPITVEAFAADTLTSAGVTNTGDLPNVVPGLTVPVSAGYSLPHLRGVGITAIGAGIENSVALYVDGVYRGVPSSAALELNNIAQVEVEKGPQGTLFGRNATGGLIQVTTLDPKPGFSGRINLGYGNFDTFTGDVYLTGGSDVIATDLAARVSHQGQGWGTNVANGEEVNKVDLNLSLRSKTIFTPAAGTKFALILDYAKMDFSTSALRNYDNVPNSFYPAGFVGLGTFNVDADAQPIRKMKEGGASLQFEQDLGFAKLVDIAAYREGEYHYIIDFDLGPSPYSTNDANQSDKAFSNELQLLSKTDSPLVWALGFYYYHAENGFDPQTISFSGPAVNPARPVTRIVNDSTLITNSYAVYGQATYNFSSRTSLTAGLRYTDEERRIQGVQTGYLNGVTPITLANVNNRVHTTTPTWRVAFSQELGDNVRAYLSYNRGFKSGGYNVTAPALAPYAPEKLDAYELGIKSQFLDKRLTLNASIFYYQYANIQVARFVNGSPQVYNGSGAELYGLDVDFTARVTDRLTLSGGIELEHTRFTDFPNADYFESCAVPYPTICSLSATGNQLPQTPEQSGTFNVDYRLPLRSSELTFNANVLASSGYYFAPNNEYKQDAYALLNGSVKWTRGWFSLSVWGKNLTNSIRAASLNQAPTALAVAYAPPRTYGATVGLKF